MPTEPPVPNPGGPGDAPPLHPPAGATATAPPLPPPPWQLHYRRATRVAVTGAVLGPAGLGATVWALAHGAGEMPPEGNAPWVAGQVILNTGVLAVVIGPGMLAFGSIRAGTAQAEGGVPTPRACGIASAVLWISGYPLLGAGMGGGRPGIAAAGGLAWIGSTGAGLCQIAENAAGQSSRRPPPLPVLLVPLPVPETPGLALVGRF